MDSMDNNNPAEDVGRDLSLLGGTIKQVTMRTSHFSRLTVLPGVGEVAQCLVQSLQQREH